MEQNSESKRYIEKMQNCKNILNKMKFFMYRFTDIPEENNTCRKHKSQEGAILKSITNELLELKSIHLDEVALDSEVNEMEESNEINIEDPLNEIRKLYETETESQVTSQKIDESKEINIELQNTIQKLDEIDILNIELSSKKLDKINKLHTESQKSTEKSKYSLLKKTYSLPKPKDKKFKRELSWEPDMLPYKASFMSLALNRNELPTIESKVIEICESNSQTNQEKYQILKSVFFEEDIKNLNIENHSTCFSPVCWTRNLNCNKKDSPALISSPKCLEAKSNLKYFRKNLPLGPTNFITMPIHVYPVKPTKNTSAKPCTDQSANTKKMKYRRVSNSRFSDISPYKTSADSLPFDPDYSKKNNRTISNKVKKKNCDNCVNKTSADSLPIDSAHSKENNNRSINNKNGRKCSDNYLYEPSISSLPPFEESESYSKDDQSQAKSESMQVEDNDNSEICSEYSEIYDEDFESDTQIYSTKQTGKECGNVETCTRKQCESVLNKSEVSKIQRVEEEEEDSEWEEESTKTGTSEISVEMYPVDKCRVKNGYFKETELITKPQMEEINQSEDRMTDDGIAESETKSQMEERTMSIDCTSGQCISKKDKKNKLKKTKSSNTIEKSGGKKNKKLVYKNKKFEENNNQREVIQDKKKICPNTINEMYPRENLSASKDCMENKRIQGQQTQVLNNNRKVCPNRIEEMCLRENQCTSKECVEHKINQGQQIKVENEDIENITDDKQYPKYKEYKNLRGVIQDNRKMRPNTIDEMYLKENQSASTEFMENKRIQGQQIQVLNKDNENSTDEKKSPKYNEYKNLRGVNQDNKKVCPNKIDEMCLQENQCVSKECVEQKINQGRQIKVENEDNEYIIDDKQCPKYKEFKNLRGVFQDNRKMRSNTNDEMYLRENQSASIEFMENSRIQGQQIQVLNKDNENFTDEKKSRKYKEYKNLRGVNQDNRKVCPNKIDEMCLRENQCVSTECEEHKRNPGQQIKVANKDNTNITDEKKCPNLIKQKCVRKNSKCVINQNLEWFKCEEQDTMCDAKYNENKNVRGVIQDNEEIYPKKIDEMSRREKKCISKEYTENKRKQEQQIKVENKDNEYITDEKKYPKLIKPKCARENRKCVINKNLGLDKCEEQDTLCDEQYNDNKNVRGVIQDNEKMYPNRIDEMSRRENRFVSKEYMENKRKQAQHINVENKDDEYITDENKYPNLIKPKCVRENSKCVNKNLGWDKYEEQDSIYDEKYKEKNVRGGIQDSEKMYRNRIDEISRRENQYVSKEYMENKRKQEQHIKVENKDNEYITDEKKCPNLIKPKCVRENNKCVINKNLEWDKCDEQDTLCTEKYKENKNVRGGIEDNEKMYSNRIDEMSGRENLCVSKESEKERENELERTGQEDISIIESQEMNEDNYAVPTTSEVSDAKCTGKCKSKCMPQYTNLQDEEIKEEEEVKDEYSPKQADKKRFFRKKKKYNHECPMEIEHDETAEKRMTQELKRLVYDKSNVSTEVVKETESLSLCTRNAENINLLRTCKDACTSTLDIDNKATNVNAWALAYVKLEDDGVKLLHILHTTPYEPGRYLLKDPNELILFGPQPGTRGKK